MTVAERSCPACHTPLPEAAQFCMHCGRATPTDPGVPPRTQSTGAIEVAQVTKALAGRYKVERVLGEGGMATVYLAEDQKHRRKVAVKVMRPELAATMGADRFLREVEIAAKLHHPHILPLYDSGESDGVLFYVMPHVEGENLKERMARQGALPPEEALRYAREVADALAYAHQRGVIHRDIKPANILLSNGHAVVADFGIARAIDDGGDVLTKTGLAVGTPQYMSPEQATGEKDVDGRADVYATGAVLYEMLTGEPPFTGQNARAILTRSLTEQPKAVTSVRAGLVPALDTLVLKTLAKQAGDRYASAEALGAALDQARMATMASSGSIPTVTPAGTEVLPKAAPPARGWLSLRNAAIGAVVVLALWAVSATVFAARKGKAEATGPAASRRRVAVLPFQNQGAATDQYFADGIADEVRGKLANVAGLSVLASGSSNQYRGSGKPPVEIAKELGADYLLTGSVRWAESGGARRVQVAPELIEAATGTVKWQQSFDTEITDVFAVQSQIATRVAGALGVALGGTEAEQIAERPTANLQSYQAYLRGRAAATGTVAGRREAATFYEQAVALDSNFALAWSALSIAMTRIRINDSPTEAAKRRAFEALERARALDPKGARTHLAAARYLHGIDHDVDGAQREMMLALQAAPRDADVLSFAATLDQARGDLSAAKDKLERAREADPRSAFTLQWLTGLYGQLQLPADMENTASAWTAVQPGDPTALQQLLISYGMRADLEGARAAARQGMERGVSAPDLAATTAGREEMSWLLADAERTLVYRLTPAAFDNDRAFWGQSLATAYWQAGDLVRARAYADSSLAESAAQANANPKDRQLHALYGLMLAYLGRASEARAAIKQALDGADELNSQYWYLLWNGARAELALGDTTRSLDYLERVLHARSYVNGRWLGADPTWKSLKGNPRFEQIRQSKP